MTDTAAETPVTVEDLRRRARAYLDMSGLSQAKAAKEVGISGSTLSQWLSGSYAGDLNEIGERVRKWLQQNTEGQKLGALMPTMPAWIETPTAARIIAAIQYAQLAQDIAVIVGGAGMGKTSAINRYLQTGNNAWKVTATPATAAQGVLLEEIALALGLRDLQLFPARLQRAIIARLNGSNGALILDEAQHLSKGAFEAARSIHDATGIGLVFSGNQAIHSRLYGGSGNGFAQLFSRVGKRVILTKPTKGDVQALAAVFGVDGVKELKLIDDIAAKPGALRMVRKTLQLAAVFAEGKGIGTDHIHAAWDELQGGDLVGGA